MIGSKKESTITILLLLVCASYTLTKITPTTTFGSQSVLKDDVVFLDLQNYFNLQSIKYPAVATGDNGIQAYLYNQSYVETNLTAKEAIPVQFVKILNEDYIVTVIQDNKVWIQHIGGEGKSFTNDLLVDLHQQDDNITCTDASFYREQYRIFVGCYTKNASTASPGFFYVFTVDFKQKKILYTLKQAQNSTDYIQNRLRMIMSENPYAPRLESSNNDLFLVIYDQRNSASAPSTSNFNAKIVRNVEQGTPKFYKLANILALDYDVLTDIFPYNGDFIAVGLKKTINKLQLTLCKFDGSSSIFCTTSPAPKTTTVTNGLVGLDQRYNRYYEVNLDTKTVKVATLKGTFGDVDWNTNVIKNISAVNFDVKAGDWIRDFTESDYNVCINFSNTNNVDTRFTAVAINYGLTGSWTEKGSGVSSSRSLITSQNISASVITNSIYRTQSPYAIVRGQSLNDGDNMVTVYMSDQETTTPVSQTGTFTLLKSIYEKIQVAGSGVINVIQGKDTWYDFKAGEITQGNGLSVTVNDSTGKITGTGYDLVPTTMKLNPPLSVYNHLSVYQDKFIVQNNNKLLFYSCVMPNIVTYQCDLQKTFILQEGRKWDNHKRIMTYSDVTFTYICNETDCYVILYSESTKNQAQFLITEDKTTLNDVMMSHDYNTGIRIIASFADKIVFYSGTTSNFALKKYNQIDSSNAPVQQFCPKNIDVCPDSQFIFEAFNDCNGNNQKIMKWNIQQSSFVYKTSVTGYSDYDGGQFCPMGDEFIVSSKTQNAPIYGFYTQDDLNYWSTPYEEFSQNLSGYKHNCLSAMKRAVFYSYNKDKTEFNVMVIYGNRGAQQVKRYPVMKFGLKVDDMEAFVGFQKNAVLHLTFVGDQPQWYQTFDGPVVKVTSTADAGVYYPDFTFTNKSGIKYTVKKAVNVVVKEESPVEDAMIVVENLIEVGKRLFAKAA